MQPGINLEFARSGPLDLATALDAAAAAGYRFIEPYVYTPLELKINSHLSIQTASVYHHLNGEAQQLRDFNHQRERLGLSCSALDAHASLLLPQIGVPYLKRAIDIAVEVDCPFVMSDEGPVPEWMTLEQGLDLFCASLEAVVRHAQARGIRVAVELHNALTTQPACLEKLLARFSPAELGVNFDTGNSFLAGNDPVDFVRRVAARVVHVHVKDIPASQLPLRGRVTGTRTGVAVGEGVVDLRGIIGVLREAGYGGVLSVECDTLAQAQASRPALEKLIG
jgi:sugar phosphate isomerase/epimerase